MFDPDRLSRFRTETFAMGQLKHPNVVPLFDAGTAHGMPYLSMELVSGGTLAKRLKTGPLPPETAAAWLADISRGVHAVHTLGIVHRDIKPSNILLEGETAKLTDFGLAKLCDGSESETVAGTVLGTPAYMSPEQAGGTVVAYDGARADVYGLGATLYHAVTGSSPYPGDFPMAVTRLVIDTLPIDVRVRNPKVPAELAKVIRKAMARDPNDRYATASELAADLDRFLANEPVLAVDPSRFRRAQAWAVRHRRELTTAVLVIGVGFLARAIGTTVRPVEAGVPTQQLFPGGGLDPRSDDLRAAIEAGKPFTLVGDRAITSTPTWPRWPRGAATLSRSTLGDGTSGFQTLAMSLLELCADPMTDRYRIEAEVKHIDGKDVTNAVGLYLGWTTKPTAGIEIGRFFAFEFDDCSAELRDAAYQPGVQARSYAVTQLADRLAVGTHSFRRISNTAARRGLENPWRKLLIDVGPDELRFSWLAQNPPIDVLTLNKGQLSELTRQHQIIWDDVAERANLPAIPTAPEWNPRRPFGIFATNANLAFRRVVLTPR